MADSKETLLEFPCRFPIKAMGRADDSFETLVVDIVARHAPGLDTTEVSVRTSNGGKWLAVTLVVEAESKQQLDAIYQDLTAHERVVWAL